MASLLCGGELPGVHCPGREDPSSDQKLVTVHLLLPAAGSRRAVIRGLGREIAGSRAEGRLIRLEHESHKVNSYKNC